MRHLLDQLSARDLILNNLPSEEIKSTCKILAEVDLIKTKLEKIRSWLVKTVGCKYQVLSPTKTLGSCWAMGIKINLIRSKILMTS
jgi:hypothetical protein